MTASRDSRGRFRPGASGNPQGRPAGTQTQRAVARIAGEHLERIVQRLVEQASEGDVSAAKVLLDRLAPVLRPVDSPVSLTLTGTPAENARAVVRALGAGEVTPNEASTVMASIERTARIEELAELTARIEALEAKL